MCFVGGTNGSSQSVSSFFFHPARFSFLLVVPVVKLLRRTGHHSAWSTFVVFPGLNLIAFWYFAFNPGPPMQSRRMPSTSSHFSGIRTNRALLPSWSSIGRGLREHYAGRLLKEPEKVRLTSGHIHGVGPPKNE